MATHGECKRCGTLHPVEDLKFVPEGEVWMRHERMARGPAGWRWRTGDVSKFKLAVGGRLCYACRGEVRPAPAVPLWKQAATAWATADPEVRRLAPKYAR